MQAKQIRSNYIQSEIDTSLVDEVAVRYIDHVVSQALERLKDRCIEKNDSGYASLGKTVSALVKFKDELGNSLTTSVVGAESIVASSVTAEDINAGHINAMSISSFSTDTIEATSVSTVELKAGIASLLEATIDRANILGGKCSLDYIDAITAKIGMIASKKLMAVSADIDTIVATVADIRELVVGEVKADRIASRGIECASFVSDVIESVSINTGNLSADNIKATEGIESKRIISDTINNISASALSKAVSVLDGDGLVTTKDGKVFHILPEELLNHESLSRKDADDHKQYLNLNGRGSIQNIKGDVTISGNLSVAGNGANGNVSMHGLQAKVATIDELTARVARHKADGDLLKCGDRAVGLVGNSFKFVTNGAVETMASKTSAKIVLHDGLKKYGGNDYVLEGLRVNPTSCIIQVRDMANNWSIVNEAKLSCSCSSIVITLPAGLNSCVALMLEV